MCVRHALTERRALINNKCETCPAGKTSTGSHNASGGDATCDATTCGANKKIVNNKCETCPAGKTSTGSHDASGGDRHSRELSQWRMQLAKVMKVERLEFQMCYSHWSKSRCMERQPPCLM